jgi:hypothetical protein
MPNDAGLQGESEARAGEPGHVAYRDLKGRRSGRIQVPVPARARDLHPVPTGRGTGQSKDAAPAESPPPWRSTCDSDGPGGTPHCPSSTPCPSRGFILIPHTLTSPGPSRGGGQALLDRGIYQRHLIP